MKTYLMSIPDSIKGISDKLNVKALLCDKSWVIYNDDGIKIVFISERISFYRIGNKQNFHIFKSFLSTYYCKNPHTPRK